MLTSFQFRAEGKTLVLQVLERIPQKYSPYDGVRDDELSWRDASIEDMLHVAELLRQYGRESE